MLLWNIPLQHSCKLPLGTGRFCKVSSKPSLLQTEHHQFPQSVTQISRFKVQSAGRCEYIPARTNQKGTDQEVQSLPFVYTPKQGTEKRKERQSDPWLQWFPVPCQGQKSTGPSQVKGERHMASQSCSWKWHFMLQGINEPAEQHPSSLQCAQGLPSVTTSNLFIFLPFPLITEHSVPPSTSELPLVMLRTLDFSNSSELSSQQGALLIGLGGKTTKEQRGKWVSM